ncbi:antigen WC1.1-like [Grus americana]|uniref:antigen WC1.1-like n=1 Tax=Grus americana TaxID=9117 RepID=UPI0024081C77|nr:antigen WC1.1-like [Grus americana]
MGMEGLLSPQVLWLLLWLQLCRGAAEVRLENGGGCCAGRVEVKQEGQWGTMCDDLWDIDDAAVVCKQLGCGSAVKAHEYRYFGPGSGPIWMFDVQCHGTESALSDCRNKERSQQYCDHSEDAGVTCSAAPRTAAPTPRADPTRGRPTGSGRVSLPVIICIILGALLCLLLALLAGQVWSARAGRRGSERAWEPFPEALYEEISYSPAWEKQARFSGSGSCSEGSLTKVQPQPGDSEEEDGPGSAPDVPVGPRGDPADGYDDAREVF